MNNQNDNQTIEHEREDRFVGERIYYDKKTVYFFPIDKTTIDRQEKMHYLCGLLWQTNFSAPIHERLLEGAKVLDIGCGAGIWIQDMCMSYPSSTFYGVDINSQLFPSREHTPKNSELITCNVLNGLPFPSEWFDFVHVGEKISRQSNTFIKSTNSHIIKDTISCYVIYSTTMDKKLIRVCKVNGWIEHMEWDAKFINESPNLKKLTDAIVEFTASKNINAMFADKLEQLLIDTQVFSKVYHESKYCPVGSWFGDYGSLAVKIFLDSVLCLRDQLSKVMNITTEGINIL
ncbi:27666_t:CDS:2 [Dentiscutata erythropus]|uniref:27666_t:CDS:1 n=1 Tax=Dentiscutata erythropus TaxID=1348616 RepID=A0A9N9CYB7_9GLOM|nr:27666_t:CDS:2 [Dentiscutata erythropus]